MRPGKYGVLFLLCTQLLFVTGVYANDSVTVTDVSGDKIELAGSLDGKRSGAGSSPWLNGEAAVSRERKTGSKQNSVTVNELAPLVVSRTPFGEEGVSAPFAGISGNALIVAGGCNFPDVPAAQGGQKVYYNTIYTLQNPLSGEATWKEAGVLPEKAAYGVSVTTPSGVVCIGGNNAGTSLKTVWLLKWDAAKSKIGIEELPSLPVAMDNMAGAGNGNTIYVAGGNVDGLPAKKAYVLRLDRLSAGWQELPSFPGSARLQPSGVVQNTAEETRFFLMGGYLPPADGMEGVILPDGYSYSPRDNQWYPVAPIQPAGDPDSTALIGAYGVASGSHHLLFTGGVNYAKFKYALNLPVQIARAEAAGNDSLAAGLVREKNKYMTYPAAWYRFNDRLLVYHTLTDSWAEEEALPQLARAGAVVVPYQGKWIVVNGELKPGVRSSDVCVVDVQTRADFGWLNWSILLVYLFCMLFLGYFFMRRENSSEDFFKGGGRIPWWAAGISIYATMLSAITYMSIPAKAFATNWTYYPMLFTILIVSFPVVKYYLPFFRRLNVTTAYEYLERRFNYSTRLMASALFITFMVARMALVLFLPSLALTTVTGIDIYICIILMGIVTIIYCTMGGVEAVVWGDVIQGFILVAGAILAAVYLIVNTDGGFNNFVDIAQNQDKFRLFNWSFDYTKATFWVVILGGLANNLISYTSDQTVIQRYLTTKDERSAGRGIMMNGLMSAGVSVIFYVIGTGLYTFFKTHPHDMSYTLANGDAIFPFFMVSQLPVGVTGLMIAAIFAATMSTISSNINSVSTAFTVDVYKHFVPGMSDKKMLKVARWTSVLSGVIGILLAVLMVTWNILSLVDYFNSILGLLASGLGGLFIMGIFFDRIDSKGALIGFTVGTAVVFLLNIYTSVSFLLYGVAGMVVSVSVALLVSLFVRENRKMKGLTWKQLEHKKCE